MAEEEGFKRTSPSDSIRLNDLNFSILRQIRPFRRFFARKAHAGRFHRSVETDRGFRPVGESNPKRIWEDRVDIRSDFGWYSGGKMIAPLGALKQPQINAAIREVVNELAP